MDQDKILKEKTEECRKLMEEDVENFVEMGDGCETIWDGILCWTRSQQGQHYQKCPEFIIGFKTEGFAMKSCTNQGWWVNPSTNTTWTNFTECLDGNTFGVLTPVLKNQVESHTYEKYRDWLPIIKLISQIGYSVSLLTLSIAFVILVSNKKLRCQRTMLHLHLFASFFMKAAIALLKDKLFVEGLGLSNNVFYKNGTLVFTREHHTWECKLIIILWQYFILATYSWLLVEGIYLHNLIFLALFSDTKSIFTHILFGWGLPVLIVVPWTAARLIYDDTLCWTTYSNRLLFLIIRIPITVCILINLLLFINITRVLLQKLKSTESYFELRKYTMYRKWVKSSFLLMPLYGIHYSVLLTMTFSIDANPTVEIIWLLSDQLFTSSQGSAVALLYCILNGEVLTELQKKWGYIRKKMSIENYSTSMWRKSSNTRSTGTAVGSVQEHSC